MRLTAVWLLAIVVLAIATPGRAVAELRTGSRTNPYLDESPTKVSSTNPRLDNTRLSLDTASGQLQVLIRFTQPVADPALTSGLRRWSYQVVIGSSFESICAATLSGTAYEIDGQLGTPGAAVFDAWADFGNEFANLPVAEAWNQDRTELTLEITTPRLVGQEIICADVSLRRRDDTPRNSYGSSTFPFLLDGFSRLDNPLPSEASDYIEENVDRLSIVFGSTRKRNESNYPLGITSVCSRAYRDTVVCRTSGRLKHIPGVPLFSLRGKLVYPSPWKPWGLGPRWDVKLRGRISWAKCPRRFKTKHTGKPCRIDIRWSGTRDLDGASLRKPR